MPFLNFDSRHFLATDKTALTTALTNLENLLASKLANLNPEERQQYGSVNEQNKLIIQKVKDYRDSQPTLSSPDIDWVEFMNDFDTRNFLQNTIQRLESLLTGLNSAKILHDWDNYQASLLDYDYTKYKNNTSTGSAYQNKAKEIGQFFENKGSKIKQETQHN